VKTTGSKQEELKKKTFLDEQISDLKNDLSDLDNIKLAFAAFLILVALLLLYLAITSLDIRDVHPTRFWSYLLSIPVSLKDSPFKKTYVNAIENLTKIKEDLDTITLDINKLHRQLEELKEPQTGYDLVSGKFTYVGMDFTPIEDTLKILDLLREDFNILQGSLAELYKIITKEITRRKCDFDVEITRDIYKNLNEFDTLILFSGDGDFKALIEDLIQSGKKVIVVFGAGHLGKEIQQINSGVYKCEINLLREFLSK
jgi:uncharacterized LabA/DUF88 family protein